MVRRLGCGYVFFISGYGLMHQYLHKADYIETFPRKRLGALLTPYIIVLLVWCTIYVVYYRSVTPLMKQFAALTGGGTVVPYSWYVLLILLMYIVFYFAARRSKRRMDGGHGIIITSTAFCVLWMTVAYLLEFPRWWYNTCLCFALGLTWARYRENVETFLRKGRRSCFCFVLSLIIFALSFGYRCISLERPGAFSVLPHALIALLELGFAIIEPVSFVICLVLILRRFTLVNKVSSYIGSLSYEIYLTHGIPIMLLRDYFRPRLVLGLLITLAITYLSALILKAAASLVTQKRA